MLFLYTAVLTTSLLTGVDATVHDVGISKRDTSDYPALPALSTCSRQCLTKALSASDCNSLSDLACLCTSDSYADATGHCLAANCTVVEGLETRKFSAVTCKQPVRNQSSLTSYISWTMFGLATFGVVARCLSRMRALGGTGYGWDDWTIILGWLILIPVNVILEIIILEGLGQDIWMLRNLESQISAALKFFYVSEWLYILEVNVTKISILLLYIRMWPCEVGWFRRACLIFMGILAAFTIVSFAVLGLGCQPLDFFWLRWDGQHQGYCINQNALIWSTAGLTIAFDIACILLPLPRLISLGIPTRKKMTVIITFVLGGFVTICSIVRLRTLVQWNHATNVTWYYNPIAIWSNIELNLGVLCACMPATAGLLQRCYSKASGKALSTYRRRPGSGTKPMEQRTDRRYELTVHNVDGTAMYRARELKSSTGSLGIHATYSELDIRPATRHDMIDLEKAVAPGTRYKPPPANLGPDQAVDQMISDGYSEFAKIRR